MAVHSKHVQAGSTHMSTSTNMHKVRHAVCSGTVSRTGATSYRHWQLGEILPAAWSGEPGIKKKHLRFLCANGRNEMKSCASAKLLAENLVVLVLQINTWPTTGLARTWGRFRGSNKNSLENVSCLEEQGLQQPIRGPERKKNTFGKNGFPHTSPWGELGSMLCLGLCVVVS